MSTTRRFLSRCASATPSEIPNCVAVLAGLFRPARALRFALLRDLGAARLDPPRVGAVLLQPGLEELGQHRDRDRGVGENAQVGVLQALIVESPAGELEVA